MKTFSVNSGRPYTSGLVQILEIKDSDIRILTLQQAREAVDRGIHIGGAFSATIPLVSLFYGGAMHFDVANPVRRGQDLFVLSKGHAVAAMASIYADLGYFSREVLSNSRSRESILNGHPGPILPGVQVSTGPLGQGLSVSQGFALVGKKNPHFDSFCMTGDGELQEGTIWEAVMFSSYKKLDNLCLIVDRNGGQLDNPRQLIVPLGDLSERLASFGWRVLDVDGTQYETVLRAIETFKYGPRDGRPTAIICQTRKGYGGFSDFMVGHKVEIPDDLMEQEIALQMRRRALREEEFVSFWNGLEAAEDGEDVRRGLLRATTRARLKLLMKDRRVTGIEAYPFSPKALRVPARDKRIRYDAAKLPRLDASKEYAASAIVAMAMREFANDERVVSIDADLGTTSGLEAGVGHVDVGRALNVGVAEANMMCIGEAFASLGYNAWVSTFCPFFDWRVLRRVAIGYQERLEAMARKDGWLNEGHGLDLTFLATAPNFETKTNGATHMGNDDVCVYSGVAHLKVIDTCCPNQLLGVMKWVMEGNRGLVYLRIMRSPSRVIYNEGFEFAFGKGYILKQGPQDKAVIVSSGRGVHEALKAAADLEEVGTAVMVVDLPSVDEQLMLDLYDLKKPILVAEQNNGYLWAEYRRVLFNHCRSIEPGRIIPVNTLDENGHPKFIHSATYGQLLDQAGLAPKQLVERVVHLT